MKFEKGKGRIGERWQGEEKEEVSSCRGIEEDRRANKDIESWLKTWRRNRAYKYLTFETIHYFANEQRRELLFHPFFPRVEITFRTMILT